MSINAVNRKLAAVHAARPVRSGLELSTIIGSGSVRLFREQLGTYDAFRSALPAGNPLLSLENLSQHNTHGGFDPLQHTYNALNLLDTDSMGLFVKSRLPGARRNLAEIVRIAVLYHDVGKINDPLDPNHPAESAEICRDLLTDPARSGVGELYQNELDLTLNLIRHHNLLGEVEKRFAAGEIELDSAVNEVRMALGNDTPQGLTLKELFHLHLLVARADIGSIPGLKHTLWSLNNLADKIFDRLSGDGFADAVVNRSFPETDQLSNDMRRLNRFIPALVTRAMQAVFQVKLQFTLDSLIMQINDQTIEYEDGRFIAHTFLRAGISEITLKEFPGRAEAEQLKQLLIAAQDGKHSQLNPTALREIGALESIQEITTDSVAGRSIPGLYKHYTSDQGHREIIARQTIEALPHAKNGELREGIYLTGLSLSPAEAQEIIFISNPDYRGRADFVISFDIVDPDLEKLIKKNGIEYFLESPIRLDDPRIRVRYQGPNYLKAAA